MSRRCHPRPLLVALAAGLALVVPLARAAAPASPADRAAATAAAAWLATQQQADGSFEVAGSTFETKDAVLAIAEAAQTGATWSTQEARDAIEAIVTGGHSPLDALDALARDPSQTAGQAAKLIAYGALPLGFNPAKFRPLGSGSPVDLVDIMMDGEQPDGSFGFFGETLQVVITAKLVATVPATTVAFIRAAQQANGGWDFTGSPIGDTVDPDLTSLAVQALVAAGADPADDPDVRAALALLADTQGPDGSWKSPFDSGNASSTAAVAIAVLAAGYDPATSCWRDQFAPARAGSAYIEPNAYIRAQQQPDGHVAGPFDGFGLNTFNTSQAVQGLLGSWLPLVRAAAQPCPPGPPTTTPTPTTPVEPTTGGGAPGTVAPLLPATGPGLPLGELGGAGAALCILGIALVGRARRATPRRGATR